MEVTFAVGGKNTMAFAEKLVIPCVGFMLIVLLFASNKAEKVKGSYHIYMLFFS